MEGTCLSRGPPFRVSSICSSSFLNYSAYMRHIMILNFNNGLLLPAGNTYDWRLEVDGQKRPGWFVRFHVLVPDDGPIFGGPVGPGTIPGVQMPQPSDDSNQE